ncbi:GNAT family N-acetyltransferase [Shewanella sedimentimangrovi]|uniref:GNAT family N-acetyltransferase n=1 Tax=Shewanella sedimentimangrovi TaxID=2814293 RepID=A0ABX7R1R2_9GAMM|nr:GNAT family N-acetyltransferase [Shewanella sedimentimangrovi]QSX37414.1 GNAT family N-acetyltransferase [Shewanella sedimentimangrovi]
MQKFIPPNGLHIRPSRPTDKVFLEKLHHASRQDLQLIDGERDFIESILAMQYRAQTQGYGDKYPNAMYFIIEKHWEPIGKATVDFGHNEVRLVDIAFMPQARGHGFGRAIIQSFQQAAAQSGVPMTLTVLQQNQAAMQLYAALGFTVECYQEPYYLMSWYPPVNKVASSS